MSKANREIIQALWPLRHHHSTRYRWAIKAAIESERILRHRHPITAGRV